MRTGKAFIQESRRLLSEEYLPKIRRSLDLLTPEDLWWRPNPESNSVGNLLLHLAGNVRQWVVAGIGEAPDTRRRQEEFDRKGGATKEDLLAHLREAVEEADAVLGSFPPERLAERRRIQGMSVSVLQAVYHVVEHFSMHTGQIIYLSKLRSGRDPGFYKVRDDDGVETTW